MTNERHFNLLYEPWIIVLNHDGTTEEVGLVDVFRKAEDYRGLSGELATQDFAMLRMLLAILHSVYGRYDLTGNFDPLYEDGQNDLISKAFQRWQLLWEQGCFSMGILKSYFEHFTERFWLFHPDYPFYQVPNLDKATEYSAAKLNGEISESSNKIRLFASRSRLEKKSFEYAEAARWLLHVNGYDDTSAKPKEKGLPSPGAGWLGKLGGIQAEGNNLFETLMLNLIFLQDGSKLWLDGERFAVWENDVVRRDERREIIPPRNPATLLTLQSRRLLLKRDQDYVIGYYLLGGDFFPPENSFVEQMTVWGSVKQKEGAPPEFKPKRHDPSRQVWRDFSALFEGTGLNKKVRPGVINWLTELKRKNILPSRYFRFQIAAVKYGDKDFFVDDVFSDSVKIHSGLLEGMNEGWISRIQDTVKVADSLAREAGQLARRLAKASGDTDDRSVSLASSSAREQVYDRLNGMFRDWLEGIDPDRDEMREAIANWWISAQKIVRRLGLELVKQRGTNALAGRVIIENNKARRYSAPEAYDYFLRRTQNYEALLGDVEK